MKSVCILYIPRGKADLCGIRSSSSFSQCAPICMSSCLIITLNKSLSLLQLLEHNYVNDSIGCNPLWVLWLSIIVLVTNGRSSNYADY